MFRSLARWGPYPPLTVALVVVSVLVSVEAKSGKSRLKIEQPQLKS